MKWKEWIEENAFVVGLLAFVVMMGLLGQSLSSKEKCEWENNCEELLRKINEWDITEFTIFYKCPKTIIDGEVKTWIFGACNINKTAWYEEGQVGNLNVIGADIITPPEEFCLHIIEAYGLESCELCEQKLVCG